MYKPVILIGNGCRRNPELVDYLCALNIPVLTTWMAIDMVAEDNPAFCGRPGVLGQRAANIIQQKADRLYCFGARLDGEQVAYDYERFAPRAEKIVYDIDIEELDKLPSTWKKNLADLEKHSVQIDSIDPIWLSWCKTLYVRFRPELEGKDGGEYTDTFAFMRCLSDAARETDLLAIGSSSGAVNAFLQAFKVKRGQRVTVCASIGAMGADIPMALGGCMSTRARTICVTGDGGFQLNAQELETIHRFNLPITFFVFSNGGYNSVRVMQDARYQGRHVGCNAESGFTIPEIRKLVNGYGVDYEVYRPERMASYLDHQSPLVVEVTVDPYWQQLPRVIANTIKGELVTDDMQDMTPKIARDELAEIMSWGND